KAGYHPYRADDSKASHMIMFDILKKIMDCDMAICDLSSKNANVFYELGLRQAFNKKTILITDGREKPPFDISGFRYVPYTPSLRVDRVKSEIMLISEMLHETENAPEDDVNSIVKLLQIQPASVEKINLNKEESVIYDMFLSLQKQISDINRNSKTFDIESIGRELGASYAKSKWENQIVAKIYSGLSFSDIARKHSDIMYSVPFMYDGKYIGRLSSIDNELVHFTNEDDKTTFPNDVRILDNIVVK
ncbi:hypothetical protein DQ657_20765, partial [Salmonella enterica]|nr:hypothetical protein [Salmonella enterica]